MNKLNANRLNALRCSWRSYVPRLMTAAAVSCLFLSNIGHGQDESQASAEAASASSSATKKIVFLAGRPSHGYGAHEHLAGCRILAEAIENSTEGVDCEVYGGGWPEDSSVLNDADSIVMYCDGGGRHPALQHLDELQKLIDRGVGFACLHYAVEVPKDNGGKEFLGWLGGYFETDWSVNPHWNANYVSLPDHPVTAGVKPFEANDEWYFHMRFQPDMAGVTPILSAIAPPDTMRRGDGPHSGNPAVRKEVADGVPQHMAWVYERDNNGRSFGFTGGHYHWNWGREDILKLVSNAIVWTAHGTIPSQGLPVMNPPVEKLEKGQDENVPEKFDAESIRREFKITQISDQAVAPGRLVTTASTNEKKKVAEKDKRPEDNLRLPERAVSGLTMHPGVTATLTASEPDLLSLTNLDIDHRGRIWVCEVVNYRQHNGERPEGDRILILEDTDQDGRADQSKVFYQGRDVDSAMGICVLGNKVIVSASPNVLVFTDEDGDDVPDRKEILFSKTGQPQHDHSAHSFLFGPDGKLYWNFGNTGQAVHDAKGNIVKTIEGNEVVDNGSPFYGGMVFRCNPDGTQFEVLGHNFRNNYEVAVDSFGAIWQSDNDDDGNRATRINYVMEYGNYGYRDQLTGAGWRAPRTNLEATIPEQHWHLNDPGVVPTMLITGAGSPTGIMIYEGDLLPEIFRNQVLHCDAGPSVVRSYPVEKSGAGYSATIENLMVGELDKWFRPADVCAAPDGSVFVTDWYDPGVGGHHMGDTERGRLFRVAPEGSKYVVPDFDFESVSGLINALQNPNQSVRYLAWQGLAEMAADGDKQAEVQKALEKLATNESPRMRARAFWALGKLTSATKLAIATALSDQDPDVRCMGIRLARQLNTELVEFAPKVLSDDSPQVRRELAVAMHFDTSEAMPQFWSALAAQYDGQDRWYLEALGIGADLRWEECLGTYFEQMSATPEKTSADIVWRARCKPAAMWLAEQLTSPDIDSEKAAAFLRALDFQSRDDQIAAFQLMADRSIASIESSTTDASQTFALDMLVESLQRLPDGQKLAQNETFAKHIKAAFDVLPVEKKLSILRNSLIEDPNSRLAEFISTGSFDSNTVSACNLLLERGGESTIIEAVKTIEAEQADEIVRMLGAATPKLAVPTLGMILRDDSLSPAIRLTAAKGLATSNGGANMLLRVEEQGLLLAEARLVVGSLLRDNQNEEIRTKAAELFPKPFAASQVALPSINKLVEMKGDVANGQIVFKTKGTCANCHVLSNEGKNVGPDLSEIGDKLAKEAMYVAIMDPSAGISHNYESFAALLESGQIVVGLMTSETEDEVTIKDAQGIERVIDREEILKLKKQEKSLMPENLVEAMSAEELVDLVEYLRTLKKAT